MNLHFLVELAYRLDRLDIEGDVVECGVFKGGSAGVLGWSLMQLKDPRRRLWLFDSFEGFPTASQHDGAFSHTLAGTHAASEQMTRDLLERSGVPQDRYVIRKGFFADTFPTVEAPTTALLHVDCDLYDSVRLCLEKFYPALTPGGFVVLNDYGIYKGAKAATTEYLEQHGLDIEPVAIDPTAAFFQKPGNGFSGLPVAGHFEGWPGAVA